MPPEVWGPIFWATFHIVSMSYPDTPTYAEKRAAKEFFKSMTALLPCPVCRGHFTDIMQTMPVDSWLDNRGSLVEWVWQVHNRVNVVLGKPEISLHEFHQRYKEMADRGLPIPPAKPTAEINDEAMKNAYVRGGFHAVVVIAIAAGIAGLLYASY